MENKLLTSYYSSPILKNISLKKIAISRGVPKWFKPDALYLPLAPSWEIIRLKDEAEYRRRYKNEILDKLDARKVIDTFKEGAVLLCWEPTGKFCHRNLVSEWIEIETGIVVPELSLSMALFSDQRESEENGQKDRQGRLFF